MVHNLSKMKIKLFSNGVRVGAGARVKFCLNLHNSLLTILLFVLMYGTQEIMCQGINLDFLELGISKQFQGNSKTGDSKYDSWAEVNRTDGVFKIMMKRADDGREIEREEKQRELKRWLNEQYRKQIGDDKLDDKKSEDKSLVLESRWGDRTPIEVFIIAVFAILAACVRLAWKHCSGEPDGSRPHVRKGF